jgi:sialic acid synthase SpsE
MLKSLELPQSWYPKLKAEADARGMAFFSTATNDITMGWLFEVGVEIFKVASPNLTHIPLIKKVAKLGRTAILSTGMATLEEIDEAVQAYTSMGNQRLCLLHCVSQYPAEPGVLRLRNINGLQSAFPYPIGFSDHSLEVGTAIAAVAMGAKIIEKHVTLDRKSKGPDHHYALEPEEFRLMCRNIRFVEQSLGDTRRIVAPEEQKLVKGYRRSLRFTQDLPAGAVIREEDLSVVRPEGGLHPRHLPEVIGMTIKKNGTKGEALTWEHFK